MPRTAYALPPGAPYSHAFSITPHDTNVLATETRALLVGVAGDVNAVLAGDGSTAVVLKLPAGIHSIAAKIVKSTSTTATNLVGLY